MSQLSVFNHMAEETTHIMGSLFQSEPCGPQRDRRQIDNWDRFNGGTEHGETKYDQEVGRKHTGVDSKHHDGSHQDNCTLVRTQDPSSPDNNAIGDNILN
jgi:hypothetical protein